VHHYASLFFPQYESALNLKNWKFHGRKQRKFEAASKKNLLPKFSSHSKTDGRWLVGFATDDDKFGGSLVSLQQLFRGFSAA